MVASHFLTNEAPPIFPVQCAHLKFNRKAAKRPSKRAVMKVVVWNEHSAKRCLHEKRRLCWHASDGRMSSQVTGRTRIVPLG